VVVVDGLALGASLAHFDSFVSTAPSVAIGCKVEKR
jgi:hypothetical protein